jgi:hypothetical protein
LHHAYANSGAYKVTIKVVDDPAAVGGGGKQSITLHATAIVAGIDQHIPGLTTVHSGEDVIVGLQPPPASTPPVSYNPNLIEIPFTTFSAGLGLTPADFANSTIAWGDGATGPAIIRYLDLKDKPASFGDTMAGYYAGHVYTNHSDSTETFAVTLKLIGPTGKILGTGTYGENVRFTPG